MAASGAFYSNEAELRNERYSVIAKAFSMSRWLLYVLAAWVRNASSSLTFVNFLSAFCNARELEQ